jgi:Carboxypeptidase regulatory-like domain
MVYCVLGSGPKILCAKRLAETAITTALLCLCLIFGLPSPGRAQATGGSISGTVTREDGGKMPGVRVSSTDQAKTTAREVTTDPDGVYNLPDLPPAVYEIAVSAPDFITQRWTAIAVGIGTERVINIVMRECFHSP